MSLVIPCLLTSDRKFVLEIKFLKSNLLIKINDSKCLDNFFNATIESMRSHAITNHNNLEFSCKSHYFSIENNLNLTLENNSK